ncbi:DUF6625 family protein [Limosilactobacillus reuteri]|uniref:DUF6625 family protein n=1 Tax=Limosilactobacillus reuteri TaxID=1598 RepID=UPI001179CAD5|nr:DUF6625 family protein [Limosilactobacillus reuteri]
MEKDVCIIPYFGKFPNYWKLWLKSAVNNEDYDFYIFTDSKLEVSFPNIKVINIQFEKFKALLQSKVSFKINLKRPYKLCDYKPMYGLALFNYIKEYPYWGFCDIDVILGDLNKFLTKPMLEGYDKIYHLGHMTLLKNNQKCNLLWKSKHHINGPNSPYRYDEAFKTPYVCNFDEDHGFTQIAENSNIKCYYSTDYADLDYTRFNFFMLNTKFENYPSVFKWKNGKLLAYYFKSGELQFNEVAYVHLQKRKMKILCKVTEDGFMIVPNQFISIKDIEGVLETNKYKHLYIEYKRKRLQMIIKHIQQHAIQQRIYRLFFKKIYRFLLDRRSTR